MSFINKIRTLFRPKTAPKTPSKLHDPDDPFLIKIGLDVGQTSQTIHKKEPFLTINFSRLCQITDAANKRLKTKYASPVPLSYLDVIAVLYSELLIDKNTGQLDLTGTHNRNEAGVLPLPSNLKDWTKEGDSPNTKNLLSVERNVKEFIVYLSEVKNNDTISGQKFEVAGTMKVVYSDFFRLPEAADEAVAMRLLAASIHDWFGAKKIANHGVEKLRYGLIKEIVDHWDTAPEKIVEFMKTNMKHAFYHDPYYPNHQPPYAEVVDSRMRNLNTSISLFKGINSST